MNPALALSRRFIGLRKRYLVRRAIQILALILALDIATNVLSLGYFFLFKAPLRTQFFLEALLAILLAQTAFRSREKPFAHFLDRTFGLKDRFYSHLQYRNNPSIPDRIREAQAFECLRSLEKVSLARQVGPRFPKSLFLTLPLCMALTIFYMNAPVSPPSPLGRAVLGVLSPQHGTNDLSAAGPDTDADRRDQTASGDPVRTEPAPAAQPSRDAAPDAIPATADAGDGKDAAAPAQRGLVTEGAPAGPSSIRSFPVTSKVSPVVPPVLANVSSGLDPEGIDPRHLLGLIPWPEASEERSLSSMARDVPTPSLEGYPVSYRRHIERYFQELLAWQTP